LYFRYTFFFDAGIVGARATMMFDYLKEGQFLSPQMQKTVCQIVTYNSNLKTAAFTEVSFTFHKGGHYQVRADERSLHVH
jgi:hypothetical protein